MQQLLLLNALCQNFEERKKKNRKHPQASLLISGDPYLPQALGLPQVLQLMPGTAVLSPVFTQIRSSSQLKAPGDWAPTPFSRFYIKPVCSFLTRQSRLAL
jgi:hypothetical protein